MLVIFLIAGLIFLISPPSALAQTKPWTDFCQLSDGVPEIKCLEAVFANILTVVMSLAGITLFVMLTVGAFRYLTSGGEPKAAEAAQKTMTSAILGLALIVGSYLILKLISTFTGIPDLLKFEIPVFGVPTPIRPPR